MIGRSRGNAMHPPLRKLRPTQEEILTTTPPRLTRSQVNALKRAAKGGTARSVGIAPETVLGVAFAFQLRSEDIFEETSKRVIEGRRIVAISTPYKSVSIAVFSFKVISGLGFYDVYPHIPEAVDGITLRDLASKCPAGSSEDTVRGVLAAFPHFVRLSATHAVRVMNPDGTVREGPSPWRDLLDGITAQIGSSRVEVSKLTQPHSVFKEYGNPLSIVKRFPSVIFFDRQTKTVMVIKESKTTLSDYGCDGEW